MSSRRRINHTGNVNSNVIHGENTHDHLLPFPFPLLRPDPVETGVEAGLQPTLRKSTLVLPLPLPLVAILLGVSPSAFPVFVRPSRTRAAGLSKSAFLPCGVDGGGMSISAPEGFRFRIPPPPARGVEPEERRAAFSRSDRLACVPSLRPRASRVVGWEMVNGLDDDKEDENEGSPVALGSSSSRMIRGVPSSVPHVMSSFIASGPSLLGSGEGRASTNPYPPTLGVSSIFRWYGVPDMAAPIRLRVGLGGTDAEEDSDWEGRRVAECVTRPRSGPGRGVPSAVTAGGGGW